ncbi:unnamed protein product [Brassica rapa]|uniref:COG4 transport protein middle alpha-helical bundle domain-containing protein n=3 Tax=Brassica TaxID=3705 RepID=A0A8D9HB09_BRACM|nr:unnamed protein product [Brassica napus]CAG7895667.1 unnamed protein product [Brassica rapa]
MNSSRKFQNDLTANKPNGKDVVSSEVSGDPKSKKPNGKSVDSSAEPLCSMIKRKRSSQLEIFPRSSQTPTSSFRKLDGELEDAEQKFMAIEENDEILRGLCGEDGVVYAICELQEECDSRGSLILKKYMEFRKRARLASDINNSPNLNLLAGGASEGPDPREVELYVEEILSLMQLGEDYTEFMVSKIKSLTSVDAELLPKATKAFRNGSFSKVIQDVTGFYVILEGFFMVENVRKAIRIDEHVPDSLTTSMVDDVFYVLQSCLRRAISTSNISSVIAVLSNAGSLLAKDYHEALQQKIREPNLGARLFLGGIGCIKTMVDLKPNLAY